MKTGFIITKDHLDNLDMDIIGPKNCELTEKELRSGYKFKMYDDDDNLCLSGFFVGNKDSEEGFMPLDCFGTAYSGCTYIKYKNENGQWEQL